MSTVFHILIFFRKYFGIFGSELLLLTDLEFSFAIKVVVLLYLMRKSNVVTITCT